MNSERCKMLSFILPLYNELENIQEMYRRLDAVAKRLGRAYEIIFVNDGSQDKSEGILNNLAIGDPCVKVIHFSRNFGQTAAIQAGIDHSMGEIIIPLDGDLQNDPNDIPHLLQKVDEGYDVASGWRRKRYDHAFTRRLPSRAANWLISRISGVCLHDYGCTLKAYRRDVVSDLKLYGEMHRFIPIYASWRGGKVVEIEVRHHPRTAGKSKYGLERIFKVILDLIVIKFLSGYSVKPIYVFGGCGVISLFLSFAAFVYAVCLKFFWGTSLIRTPLPLVMVMFFVTGVMCILLGLIAEVLMRTYYESQDKKTYRIRNTANLP